MPDQLTLNFDYSPVDHANALSELPPRKFVRLIGRFGGGLVGVLTLVGIVIGIGFTDLSYWEVLAETLPTLGMSIVWFYVHELWKRFDVVRFGRTMIQRPEQLTFDADGFVPSKLWSQPLPWAHVDRILETERFIVIYHAMSMDPVFVPKYALSRPDEERLRNLMTNAFAARPAKLKLRSGAT